MLNVIVRCEGRNAWTWNCCNAQITWPHSHGRCVIVIAIAIVIVKTIIIVKKLSSHWKYQPFWRRPTWTGVSIHRSQLIANIMLTIFNKLTNFNKLTSLNFQLIASMLTSNECSGDYDIEQWWWQWIIRQQWFWNDYDDYGIKGEFTLFAPTDLAFNEFLQKLGGVKVVKFFSSHIDILVQTESIFSHIFVQIVNFLFSLHHIWVQIVSFIFSLKVFGVFVYVTEISTSVGFYSKW